ncbi:MULTISPECIES: Pycsar system effector family protein [unclassified Streptomyces]|uniref:Pycsar system effector family protein n=1 Tax=unclassified Streptomyces TaxID=2593676 RepID=UPI000EF92A0F|nr:MULTISPECIES: Pycsar system effector family protein [unclassified Streptomyces]
MTDLDLTTPDTAPPPDQDADPSRPHPAHLPLPTAGTPAPPPPGATVAARLLADLHTEIGRADSKAAVLVAALGMTAGVFTGLLAGKDWAPGSLGAAGLVLWWAGTAALAVSLLALLLAVLPRYRADAWAPGEPLSYFADIRQAAAAGEAELTRALAATEHDPLHGLARALTGTSRIAAAKHRWIRAGLIAFSAGSVLLPAAVLTG